MAETSLDGLLLIIEDDKDTRDLMARVLSAEGYNIRLATNGWEDLLAVESVFPKLKVAMRAMIDQPRPHARVNLPEPRSMIHPYLGVYRQMLAWS